MGVNSEIGRQHYKDAQLVYAGDYSTIEELRTKVLATFLEDVASENHIKATDTEIAEFLKAIKSSNPSMKDLAYGAIVGWKMDKFLYEKYSGTVIFQQGNPYEPVGAYLGLLKEMEKEKKLIFHDEKVEKEFWKYFTMKYRYPLAKEKINFSVPWWLTIAPK